MNEGNGQGRSQAVLVIGGGISGLTAAVEMAEAGREVYLIERSPSLGGRVAAMRSYFPKMCPPSCGLEINYRRLRNLRARVRVFTLAQVVEVAGQAGAFDVAVRLNPRYVNERCTGCDECVKVCPVERPDAFNYGMGATRAIYREHAMALPARHVIDMGVCRGKVCAQCVPACKYDAIDLDMAPKTIRLQAGAIVVATGWTPYDAASIENLGFGRFPDVITNVMMERLAARNGTANGPIARPSDGRPVRRAVFVHCAGSRDANHLAYCSSVCCLASLKQAAYLRERNPESKAHLFYIDLRASGVYEDFLVKTQQDTRIVARKGKVAKVAREAASGDLVAEVEDVLGGGKLKVRADLVVLATGMVSNLRRDPPPVGLRLDEYGFAAPEGQPPGIIPAGTAKGPMDVASAVRDATGAALAAIQAVRVR